MGSQRVRHDWATEPNWTEYRDLPLFNSTNLQSLSTMILELKKIKSATVSILSPSVCRSVIGPDALILVFLLLDFKLAFHSLLSPSSRGSLVPFHFLPLGWYRLHIWDCWYFSQHEQYNVLCIEVKQAGWQNIAFCCSFAKSHPTICDPMDCSLQGPML